MQTYRTETTVSKDRSVALKDLPFAEGEQVEVIVRRHALKRPQKKRYPLRGQPISYPLPFNSVAEDDWEALK